MTIGDRSYFLGSDYAVRWEEEKETHSALRQEDSFLESPLQVGFSQFASLTGDGIMPTEGGSLNITSKMLENLEFLGVHSGGGSEFFSDVLERLCVENDSRYEAFVPQIESFRLELAPAARFAEIQAELRRDASVSDDGEQSLSEGVFELNPHLVAERGAQFWRSLYGYRKAWIPFTSEEFSIQGALGASKNDGMLLIDFEKGSFSVVNSSNLALQSIHPSGKRTKVNQQGEVAETIEYQKFVTYSGCDKEVLNSPHFFELLLTLTASKTPCSVHQLCEAVRRVTGGKKERPYDVEKFPQMYGKGVRSTSGKGECISTALSYHLMRAYNGKPKRVQQAEKAYKLIKWKWKMAAFTKFFKKWSVGFGSKLLESISDQLEEVPAELQDVLRENLEDKSLEEVIRALKRPLAVSFAPYLGRLLVNPIRELVRDLPDEVLNQPIHWVREIVPFSIPSEFDQMTLREVIEQDGFSLVSGISIHFLASFLPLSVDTCPPGMTLGELLDSPDDFVSVLREIPLEIFDLPVETDLQTVGDIAELSVVEFLLRFSGASSLPTGLFSLCTGLFQGAISNMARATEKTELADQLTEEEKRKAAVTLFDAKGIIDEIAEIFSLSPPLLEGREIHLLEEEIGRQAGVTNRMISYFPSNVGVSSASSTGSSTAVNRVEQVLAENEFVEQMEELGKSIREARDAETLLGHLREVGRNFDDLSQSIVIKGLGEVVLALYQSQDRLGEMGEGSLEECQVEVRRLIEVIKKSDFRQQTSTQLQAGQPRAGRQAGRALENGGQDDSIGHPTLLLFALFDLNLAFARKLAPDFEWDAYDFHIAPLLFDAKLESFRSKDPRFDRLFFQVMESLQPDFTIGQIGKKTDTEWLQKQENALFAYTQYSSDTPSMEGLKKGRVLGVPEVDECLSPYFRHGRLSVQLEFPRQKKVKAIQTQTFTFFKSQLAAIDADPERRAQMEDFLPSLVDATGFDRIKIFAEAFSRGVLGEFIPNAIYQLHQTAAAIADQRCGAQGVVSRIPFLAKYLECLHSAGLWDLEQELPPLENIQEEVLDYVFESLQLSQPAAQILAGGVLTEEALALRRSIIKFFPKIDVLKEYGFEKDHPNPRIAGETLVDWERIGNEGRQHPELCLNLVEEIGHTHLELVQNWEVMKHIVASRANANSELPQYALELNQSTIGIPKLSCFFHLQSLSVLKDEGMSDGLLVPSLFWRSDSPLGEGIDPETVNDVIFERVSSVTTTASPDGSFQDKEFLALLRSAPKDPAGRLAHIFSLLRRYPNVVDSEETFQNLAKQCFRPGALQYQLEANPEFVHEIEDTIRSLLQHAEGARRYGSLCLIAKLAADLNQFITAFGMECHLNSVDTYLINDILPLVTTPLDRVRVLQTAVEVGGGREIEHVLMLCFARILFGNPIQGSSAVDRILEETTPALIEYCTYVENRDNIGNLYQKMSGEDEVRDWTVTCDGDDLKIRSGTVNERMLNLIAEAPSVTNQEELQDLHEHVLEIAKETGWAVSLEGDTVYIRGFSDSYEYSLGAGTLVKLGSELVLGGMTPFQSEFEEEVIALPPDLVYTPEYCSLFGKRYGIASGLVTSVHPIYGTEVKLCLKEGVQEEGVSDSFSVYFTEEYLDPSLHFQNGHLDTSIRFTVPLDRLFPEGEFASSGALYQTAPLDSVLPLLPQLEKEEGVQCFIGESDTLLFKEGELLFRVDERGVTEVQKGWVLGNNDQLPEEISEAFHGITNHLQVWLDGEGHLASLFLPDEGLRFDAIGTPQRLRCRQHPGFYLERQGPLPKLNTEIPRISLRNEAGTRKVLIPTGAVTNLLPDSVDQDLFEGRKWIILQSDERTWKAVGEENTLPLAVVLFLSGEVEEGLQVLNYQSAFKKLNKADKLIYLAIVLLASVADYPMKHSIALKVFVRLEEDRLRFPSHTDQEEGDSALVGNLFGGDFGALQDSLLSWSQAAVLFFNSMGYHLNRGNHPLEMLTREEEVLLYRHFESLSRAAERGNRRGEEERPNFLEKVVKGALDEIIPAVFRALYSSRKSYLETGRGRVGVVPVSHIPFHLVTEYPAFSLISERQLVSSFPGASNVQAIDLHEHLLVQADAFYEENFWSLYQMAKTGDQETKQRLQQMCDVAIDGEEWHRLVSEVVKKPNTFPSIARLDRFFQAHRDALDPNERGISDEERERRRSVSESLESRRDAQFQRISTFGIFANVKGFFQVILPFLGSVVSQLFFGQFGLFTRAVYWITSPFRGKTLLDRQVEVEPSPINLHCDVERIDSRYQRSLNQTVERYFTRGVFDSDEQRAPVRIPDVEGNEALQRYVDRVNRDIDAYREENLNEVLTSFTLNRQDGFTLPRLERRLRYKAQTARTNLVAKKTFAIQGLNAVPCGRTEYLLQKIGFQKELEWTDLRKLALEGDYAAFRRQTALTDAQAEQLIQLVVEILAEETRVQQIELALETIKKAKEMEPGEEREAVEHNLAVLLLGQRHYTPSFENISLLLFESANGYHFRERQIEKIRESLDLNAKEQVIQAPTGFGKTKACIPTLNYAMANRGYLVFNSWPHALEMQNSRDIFDQMGYSFHSGVVRFTFSRNTRFTKDHLLFLYEELERCEQRGTTVNLSPQSLLAFQLHWFLLLDEDPSPRVDEEIRLMMKVLKKIRQKGWATIDEVHEGLSPYELLIYTLSSSEIVPARDVELMSQAFRILLTDEFSHLRIRENKHHFAEFSEADRRNLAIRFIDWFNQEGTAPSRRIGDEIREEYLDFVLRASCESVNLQRHPRFSEICLVKGLISCGILDSAFKEPVGVGYGFSLLHFMKSPFAVPYTAPNVPKETEVAPSQYQNPHVTFAKTMMCYLLHGIRKSQALDMIYALREDYNREVRNNISHQEMKSVRFYESVAPRLALQEGVRLEDLGPQHLELLFEEVQHCPESAFYVIEHVVRGKYKLFNEYLEASPQDFREAFAESTSFSATPQHVVAHGTETELIPMVGTTGRTAHLLLTKCQNPEAITLLPSGTNREMATHVAREFGDQSALIDLGANFVGLKNVEVAQLLGEFNADEELCLGALLFDDEDNLIKEYSFGAGEIGEAFLPAEQRLTYYDASHTVGADIDQPIRAKAILLAGKRSTLDEVGQAGGRMRKWHLMQQVNIGIPQEVFETLERDEEGNLSIQTLLLSWMENQIEEEKQFNVKTQPQQIEAKITNGLIESMLGIVPGEERGISPSRARKVFAENRKKFVKEQHFDPISLYGGIPDEIPETLIALEAYKDSQLEAVRRLKGVSRAQKMAIVEEICKVSGHWLDEGFALPNRTFLSSSLENDVETQQEVEVQVEQETQIERQERIAPRTASEWADDLDLFHSSWERPIRSIDKKVGNFFHAIVHPLAKPIRGALILGGISTLLGVALSVATFVSGVALPLIFASNLAINAVVFGGVYLLRQIAKRFRVNGTSVFSEVVADRVSARYREAAHFFSPNLLCSNNYVVVSPQSEQESVQTPWEEDQKSLTEVVVIQDTLPNGEKKIQLLLIDQYDGEYFRRRLRADRSSDVSQEEADRRSRKIGIYGLTQNSLLHLGGKNQFTPGELEENEEFVRLLTQAKFIDGRVFYTEQEYGCVEERARLVGGEVEGESMIKVFFERVILKTHPTGQGRFVGSQLEEILATSSG